MAAVRNKTDWDAWANPIFARYRYLPGKGDIYAEGAAPNRDYPTTLVLDLPAFFFTDTPVWRYSPHQEQMPT